MLPQTAQPAIDLVAWRRQRNLFPEDQLRPYWGQQVAWSADGKRIVASAPNNKELYQKLVALGAAGHEVVFEFIEDPDVSYL